MDNIFEMLLPLLHVAGSAPKHVGAAITFQLYCSLMHFVGFNPFLLLGCLTGEQGSGPTARTRYSFHCPLLRPNSHPVYNQQRTDIRSDVIKHYHYL
jgi:hypothetical protein